ncbi:MAG: MXAN_5187 C-terminal domain-containing protein [Myxococcota bacterium]
MFLSKIWILVISFISILALAGILVANKPSEYFHEREYREKIVDFFQAAVDKEIEWESRQILDSLGRIRLDNRIVKVLEKKGDTNPLKKPFQNFAKKLNIDYLLILNPKGKVLISHKDIPKSFAGYPAFKNSMKGYHSDNALKIGDSMYQIFSVPVLSKDHKRIVGVLVGLRKMNQDFLEFHLSRMGFENKRKRKVEMALFVKNKAEFVTKKSKLWDEMSSIYKEHKKDIRDIDKGFTPVKILKKGGKRYAVILSAVRGAVTVPKIEIDKELPEFQDTETYYAIAFQMPQRHGSMAFLKKVIPQDKLLEGFPWVLFIVGASFIMILGISLLIIEGDLPMKKMINRAKDLSKGEFILFNDQEFSGKYRALAIAINEALEKARESSGGNNIKKKSMDEILGKDDEDHQLPEGGPPPPPVKGKPIKYPEMKKVKLNGKPNLPDLPKTKKPSKNKEQPNKNTGKPSKKTESEISTPQETDPSQPQPPGPEEDPGEYFSFITEEFKSLKLKLEGNLDNFDEVKFIQKLNSSTQNIRAKKECTRVKLVVYERDGKAGLKAVAVK